MLGATFTIFMNAGLQWVHGVRDYSEWCCSRYEYEGGRALLPGECVCGRVCVCVGVEVLQLGYFRQPNVAHYDSFHCMQ